MDEQKILRTMRAAISEIANTPVDNRMRDALRPWSHHWALPTAITSAAHRRAWRASRSTHGLGIKGRSQAAGGPKRD